MNKFYLLVAGMTLSFAGYSQARYLHPNGVDNGTCNLPINACATIAYAASQANPGDTVLLDPGNYTFATTQNVTESVIISAANMSNKPVITSTASDVLVIDAPNVVVNGLDIRMGLTATTGLRGIVVDTDNDNITISNNNIISTKLISSGMIFEAYAIAAYGGNGNSVSIVNNEIKPNTLANDAFGRGIALGISGLGNGAGGEIVNNTIQAYYPIQAVVTTADLEIADNTLTGTVMLGYPSAGVEVNINDNTFSGENALIAPNLYALLEVRSVNGATVNIDGNTFENYVHIGLFSSASNGVHVTDNTFSPLSSATNFASIHANTKLMTSGTQNSTHANGIEIKGNTFNAGSANNGAAIIYADHYGVTSPAFTEPIQIGGTATTDKNTFHDNLKYFIQLDASAGNSDAQALWAGYGVTTMKPFSQNVRAYTSWNIYPTNDTAVLAAKIFDINDNNDVGRVILNEPLSLNENATLQIISFPNPTVDVLYIQATELDGKNTIKIIDVQGRVVVSTVITSGATLAIPVAELSNGVYTINIENNGKFMNSRFVKN